MMRIFTDRGSCRYEIPGVIVEDKKWKEDILKELKDQDVVAVESIGILTEKDIRAALNAIKECETKRDENEEKRHIKELQRQRAARVYGA
jgi:hypothetical protein